MANVGFRIKQIITALRVPGGYQGEHDDSSSGLAIFTSIMAALLIWFMISMQESYSIVRDFPVMVVNMPPDTALQENLPASVEVLVEGQGWQLLRLYTTLSPIQIDASLGTVDMLRLTAVSLAPDFIPRSVNPAEITLSLEKRTTRMIPIRVRHELQTVPPFNLVREMTAQPESLEVSGAVSVLATLEYWPTEVLRRERVNGSFSVSIVLSDTLSGLVDRSLNQVDAIAEVVEFTENRRLLDVSVIGAPPGASGFRLIPDQVAVRYTVPIRQFEASAVTDSFYAVVRFEDILSDTTGRVSPSVRIPNRIVVRDLHIETSRLQYYVILE